MGNHTALATTDPHATQVAAIEGRLTDLVKGLDTSTSTPTNLPVGAHRWNASTERDEKWNGTAWSQRSASWDLSTSGLTFTGTGKRITGDFSNATQSSRLLFQSSTTNGATNVGAIPNGTSRQGMFTGFNSADPSNASNIQIGISDTSAWLTTYHSGTGADLPLTFQTGGSERARMETDGRFSYKNYDAFRARVTSGQTSGTDGAVVAFDAVKPTAGSGFDTSTDTFTATKAGWYSFGANLKIYNALGSAQTLSFMIETSGAAGAALEQWIDIPAGVTRTICMQTQRELAIGDTAKVLFGTTVSNIEILSQSEFFGRYVGTNS